MKKNLKSVVSYMYSPDDIEELVRDDVARRLNVPRGTIEVVLHEHIPFGEVLLVAKHTQYGEDEEVTT